jgi:hypothetical protein
VLGRVKLNVWGPLKKIEEKKSTPLGQKLSPLNVKATIDRTNFKFQQQFNP